MGDGTVQITLPDGTTSRGAPAEMLAVVQGRLRAAGVPESAAVAAAEAIIAGEFESGDAVLRYREGGGGNLAHDVIRNIVYGRDGAIVLGQWANKFGANPTAFHMIGDLSNNDPGYVLLLAQWTALSAMTVPDYAAPLLTISAQLGAAYQPDIVVTGDSARANRSPRVQYALDRIAAYEREHPGSQARWARERAAQHARVQGALAQFDRDVAWGVTLGPRLGAEMAAGTAVLSWAVKGYRTWRAGRAAQAADTEVLTGVRANQLAGASREALVRSELAARYPGATVQNEVYLRTASGQRALDPLTGQARRLDSVVIQGGRLLDSVEVTSLNANKAAQIAREMRIRQSGGTFIRDRATGALLDISQIPTRIVRKP
jgi:hypothetical protein